MNLRRLAAGTVPLIPAILAASTLFAISNGCSAPPSKTVAPDVAAPADTGPADQEWMDRRARFAQAIEGLSFEEGVVEIIEPLAGDVRHADALQREGIEHYDHSRFIESIRAHAHAVRARPDFAPGYHRLGEALLAYGRHMEYAIAAYRTAVQLEPDFVEARFALAMILWMEQDSAGAIEQMNEAVMLDPNHALAHERLAIWHYYTGDFNTAWSHVHAAVGLDHTMPPQFIALLEARMPDPQR